MPKKKVQKKKQKKSGFTLLELIAAASIIAIMAAFFLATYPASQRRARDTQRISDLEQYRNALQLYANAQENMNYPNSNGNHIPLHAVCNNNLLAAGFAAQCPTDPDPSQSNNYTYVGVNGGEDFYVYAQLEEDPVSSDANKNYYVVTSYGNSGQIGSNMAPGKDGIPPFK